MGRLFALVVGGATLATAIGCSGAHESARQVAGADGGAAPVVDDGSMDDEGEGAASNPCDVDHGGCDPLSECTEQAGSVSCGPCPEGYEDANGDGSQCVDVDECATVASCAAGLQCINRDGGYACAERLLLVPDSLNRSVGIFSGADGHYCRDFVAPEGCTDPSTGAATDCFLRPIGAILGPDGRVYVSDSLARRVLVFDAAGQLAQSFDVPRPRGMAFHGNELWVAAAGESGVDADGGLLVFDQNGNAIAHPVRDDGSYDVLLLGGDHYLMSNQTSDVVTRFDASHSATPLFSTPMPEQLTPTPEGTFYVGNSDINYLTEFDVSGEALATGVNVRDPTGAVVLDDGNLFVTGQEGAEIYTPEGLFVAWPKLPKFRGRMVEWIASPDIGCDP
jgi:hypothetical protein